MQNEEKQASAVWSADYKSSQTGEWEKTTVLITLRTNKIRKVQAPVKPISRYPLHYFSKTRLSFCLIIISCMHLCTYIYFLCLMLLFADDVPNMCSFSKSTWKRMLIKHIWMWELWLNSYKNVIQNTPAVKLHHFVRWSNKVKHIIVPNTVKIR